MSDRLKTPEDNVMSIVAKLSEFDIDPVDPVFAEVLKKEEKPQLRELGELLTHPSSMTEYDARVARAREAVGLDSTTSVENIREKFYWRAGDEVNLDELFQQMKDEEEVQFRDYRGRRYNIIKGKNGLRVLEAYDEHDKPLIVNGKTLEGEKVLVDRLKTENDAFWALHGFSSIEPTIRLVEKGVSIRNTEKGEEYTETVNGTEAVFAAQRMHIVFPDLKQSWGMLVSEIDLVAEDQDEVQKLEAAHWRIMDSISVIKNVLAANPPNWSIEVGTEKIDTIEFGDQDEIGFVVYGGSPDNPTRTEYYFSVKHGSSEKEYIKAVYKWVVGRLPNQELNGSVLLHPIKAARILDAYRYKLLKSSV